MNIMKRNILIVLAAAAVFAGCNESADSSNNKKENSDISVSASNSADTISTGDPDVDEQLRTMLRDIEQTLETNTEELHITDMTYTPMTLSVTVEEKSDIETVKNWLESKGKPLACVDIHTPYQEIVPVPPKDGKTISDIDSVRALLEKYSNEFKYVRCVEKGGKIFVELEEDYYYLSDSVKEYLEACGVDMEIIRFSESVRENT